MDKDWSKKKVGFYMKMWHNSPLVSMVNANHTASLFKSVRWENGKESS